MLLFLIHVQHLHWGKLIAYVVVAELRAHLLFLLLGTCIKICFRAWCLLIFTVMETYCFSIQCWGPDCCFFLLHCTACCCFVSSKLTLTSPDAQVHFILALQWVDDIGLLLAIHIISCKCILKLWLFFYHTHSRNLDNHRFTSASKVPAAFTKIHIVSLCVCFVQLLFMCLKIWLPILLMVELLVFYVLLLLPANICSNAADLLRLSVYIVWVVAWHMYYDAVMCDVDFCCDEKQLMSEC